MQHLKVDAMIKSMSTKVRKLSLLSAPYGKNIKVRDQSLAKEHSYLRSDSAQCERTVLSFLSVEG